MANQYINKVIYGGTTLLDLTSDSVAPSDVLAGATFHNAAGAPTTGTMRNVGTQNIEITNKTTQTTITEGKHNGSGKAYISAAEAAKLIPENIKKDVNILGVLGTLTSGNYMEVINQTIRQNSRYAIIPFEHRPRFVLCGRSPLMGASGNNLEYYFWDGKVENAIHMTTDAGKTDITSTSGWQAATNSLKIDSRYTGGEYTYYYIAFCQAEHVPGLYQTKTVTPSQSRQVITADSDYDALGQVNVDAVTNAMIQGWDTDLTASNVRKNVEIFGVTGSYAPNVTPAYVCSTRSTQTITPDPRTDGFSDITVGAITDAKIRSWDSNLTASNIKKNTTIFGVTGIYAPSVYSQAVTSTRESRTITPVSGFDGFSSIVVNPITDTMIQSWDTTNFVSDNIKSGVNIFGVTGSYVAGGGNTKFSLNTTPKSISGTSYQDSVLTLTIDNSGTYHVDIFCLRISSGSNMGSQIKIVRQGSSDIIAHTNTTWTGSSDRFHFNRFEQEFVAGDVVTVQARGTASYVVYPMYIIIQKL